MSNDSRFPPWQKNACLDRIEIEDFAPRSERKGGVAARGAVPRCMLPYSAEKRTQAMEQGLLKPAGSTKLEELQETAVPFTGR